MAEKPEYRLFIDSNVLISGIYSTKGPPAKILFTHAMGQIRIVVSQLVLQETVFTLKEKVPEAIPALNAFLTGSPPEIVVNPAIGQVKKWADYLQVEDAVIFAAAVSAEPDYFVTGDKHFLLTGALETKSGLSIVTPARVVKLLSIQA